MGYPYGGGTRYHQATGAGRLPQPRALCSGLRPRQIRAELKRHRIPSDLIDQAIDELTEEAGDEAEERLHALLASKLRSLPKSLERRKVWERLLRFGAYRGFPYEEVQTVIQELLGSSYDEDEP